MYLDPDFTGAAFALARAYAAIGDTTSAGRVHQQAPAVVDSEQEPRPFERREADALRTACGARLKLVGDDGRGA